MKSYIGGTKIMAWVARVLSPSPQVMRAEELGKFRENFRLSMAAGEVPNTAAGRQKQDRSSQGTGLIAREITHASHQAYPHRWPHQAARREDSSIEVVLPPESHSQMVLRAFHRSSPPGVARQMREEGTGTTEQAPDTAANGTEPDVQVDCELIADRVYRLMQYDLILEKERATRVGG